MNNNLQIFYLTLSGIPRITSINLVSELTKLGKDNGLESVIQKFKKVKSYILTGIKPEGLKLHHDGSPYGHLRSIYKRYTEANEDVKATFINVFYFYTSIVLERVTPSQLDKFLNAVEKPKPFRGHLFEPVFPKNRLDRVNREKGSEQFGYKRLLKIFQQFAQRMEKPEPFTDVDLRVASSAPVARRVTESYFIELQRLVDSSAKSLEEKKLRKLAKKRLKRRLNNPNSFETIQECEHNFIEDQISIIRSPVVTELMNLDRSKEDLNARLVSRPAFSSFRRGARRAGNFNRSQSQPVDSSKRLIDLTLKEYMDNATNFWPTMAQPPHTVLTKYVGTVEVSQQEGGKARFFGNPNRFLQHLLEPLKLLLFDALTLFPEDCTHNQRKADEAIKWFQLMNKPINSIDLTNASDTLPLSEQLKMLRNLLTDIKRHYKNENEQELRHISTYLEVALKIFKELASGTWLLMYDSCYRKDIRWKKGQVLGLGPSFPLFALYHHTLLQGIMTGKGLSRFMKFENDFEMSKMILSKNEEQSDEYRFFQFWLNNGFEDLEKTLGSQPATVYLPRYFILGDDIIILDTSLAETYMATLNSIGVDYSKDKSFFNNTDFAEFGGKIFHKGKILQTTKWKEPNLDNEQALIPKLGYKGIAYVQNRFERNFLYMKAFVPDFLGGFGFNPLGLTLDERLALMDVSFQKRPYLQSPDFIKRRTRLIKLDTSQYLIKTRDVADADTRVFVPTFVWLAKRQMFISIPTRIADVANLSRDNTSFAVATLCDFIFSKLEERVTYRMFTEYYHKQVRSIIQETSRIIGDDGGLLRSYDLIYRKPDLMMKMKAWVKRYI